MDSKSNPIDGYDDRQGMGYGLDYLYLFIKRIGYGMDISRLG